MSTNTPVSALKAGTVMVGDFHINRMAYGAMRITGPGIWGEPEDLQAAREVLRRAVELDVNFIDTADSYGPEVSEGLIAETLRPYQGIVIATKGGMTRSGPNQWSVDCRPEHLRAACEGSLRRLGVDRIDLYQLHSVDPRIPFEESFQTMLDLQQEGKIRYIGLSNIEPEQFESARAMGTFVSVQNRYNVLNREHENVLKLCEQHGIAFIPYFPIGGNRPGGIGDMVLSRVADKHQATTRQVALAWLLAHSPQMLPIPGTSSVAHLEENIAAAALRLDASDLAALDAVHGA